MKKSVLFVLESQIYNGVCVILDNILQSLDYNKYDVTVLFLTRKGNYFKKETNKNFKIIYGDNYFKMLDINFFDILKKGNVKNIFRKIDLETKFATGAIEKEIVKCRESLLEKKYDVEIAFHDGFPVLFTAHGTSDKKIAWLHLDYTKYDPTEKDRKLYDKAFKKIDEIIATTEDVKKSFKIVSKTDKKVSIIESLIDVEKIKKLAKEEKVEFDKKKLNFVCVGKMSKQKGYLRLMAQLEKLKFNGLLINVVIHIIGDGPEKSKIVKLIKDLGLEEHVKLYGYIKNPYPYIKAADMVLVPSLYEGQCIGLLEAATLGAPVLVTRFSSDVYEILDKGAYGLICHNTDEGIYNGIEEIIKNKIMIQKYRKNIKEFVYTDKEKIVKKIENLLDK